MTQLAFRLTLVALLLLLTAGFVDRSRHIVFDPFETAVTRQALPTSRENKRISAITYQPIQLGTFQQTLSRPIFFEGRQFPQPRAAPIAEAAPPPPQEVSTPAQPSLPAESIKLRGVLQTGGIWQALIEVQQKAPAWLEQGQKLEDWEITAINPNSIVIKSRHSEATLELYPSQPKD